MPILIDILYPLICAPVLIFFLLVGIYIFNMVLIPYYSTQLQCRLFKWPILLVEDSVNAEMIPGDKKNRKNIMFRAGGVAGMLLGSKNKNRFVDLTKLVPGSSVNLQGLQFIHYYPGVGLPFKLENLKGQQDCLAVMKVSTDHIKEDLGDDAAKVIEHNDLLCIIANTKPEMAIDLMWMWVYDRKTLEKSAENYLILPTDYKPLDDADKEDKAHEKRIVKLIEEIGMACQYCNDMPVKGGPTALSLMMRVSPIPEICDELLGKVDQERKQEAQAAQGNNMLLIVGGFVGITLLFVMALIIVIAIM